MGLQAFRLFRTVTELELPPRPDEFELTLIGPGYGESIVIHTGQGRWIIVDSCVDAATSVPFALRYLNELGVDSSVSVDLIAATHWDQDHIRGMGRLARECSSASFFCPAVFMEPELWAIIGAVERKSSSGVRELHDTLTALADRKSHPKYSISNRLLHRHDDCEVWSLSSSDRAYFSYVGSLLGAPPEDVRKRLRLVSLSPNRASSALWVRAGKVAVLLGADLPRAGWTEVLDSGIRPTGRASVFKLAHHDSSDAHDERVWEELMDGRRIAILAPYSGGTNPPPTGEDAKRILSFTKEAYITALPRYKSPTGNRHPAAVEKLEEMEVRKRATGDLCAVRLRRSLNMDRDWEVQKIGDACDLSEYLEGLDRLSCRPQSSAGRGVGP